MLNVPSYWLSLPLIILASNSSWAAAAGGKVDLQRAPVPEVIESPAYIFDHLDEFAAPGLDMPQVFTIEPAAAKTRLRDEASNDWSYTPDDFVSNATLIPWETAAVVGGTLALGFSDWDWGSAKFHFTDEGFFGKDTHNGGMDKLGHAYGSALLADFFTARLNRQDVDPTSAALTGSIMAFGVMGMVETFDGFSADYGFSPQDIAANTTGIVFSFLRNTVPGLKNKVDYRLEYWPSGYDHGFKPHSDYAGQKYVLALKLAGFERFEESPLRFVELQAGYFTEGFKANEARERGISRSRHPYIGIGINLEQVLFGYEEEDENTPTYLARQTLQRVQVPFTYLSSDPHAYRY